MLVIITQEFITVPKLVPRINGTPVLYDIENLIRKNKNGKSVIVPIFSLISENLFIGKDCDIVPRYATPDISSILIDETTVYEVFAREEEGANACRVIEMDLENPKWFYVRGHPHDADLEKYATVGLYMGKSVKEVLETLHDFVPNFNRKQYHLLDRKAVFDMVFTKSN